MKKKSPNVALMVIETDDDVWHLLHKITRQHQSGHGTAGGRDHARQEQRRKTTKMRTRNRKRSGRSNKKKRSKINQNRIWRKLDMATTRGKECE